MQWGAQIINNPSSILPTCHVNQNQWDSTLSCGTSDCSASPVGEVAVPLNINYSNLPISLNISSKPYAFTTPDLTINANLEILSGNYDLVKYNWSGHKLSFMGDTTSGLLINDINSMTSNDELFITSYNTVKIGSLLSGNNVGNKVMMNNIPSLEINTLTLGQDSTIEINTTESIKMNTFSVGRDNSTVILRSPKISMNNLTISNSGNNNAYITLYADEIDIGLLNMQQNANVVIYPYTPGKSILLRSNTIQASSSSTLLLSSGDYYVLQY